MSDKLTVILHADDEAMRLWTRAERLLDGGDDLTTLLEAMDLGVRAIEIALVSRLQEVREDFPATIFAMLSHAEPPVNVQRDAVQPPHVLGFTELVDLLSPEESACVAPGLHRGWEDRHLSCKRSRKTAQDAVGYTLTMENREQLMLLSAYRNRVFRLPPPVAIVVPDLQNALAVLRRLSTRFVRG